MRDGIIKKVGRFETHHRIAVFSVVLVATIVLTRLAVQLHDPNPTFFGLELHHFDYGILLLLISSQLSLFGTKKLRNLYLFLTAVASGLILDEYWMIRHSVERATNPAQEYHATMFSVMILVTAFMLVTLFVRSIRKKS